MDFNPVYFIMEEEMIGRRAVLAKMLLLMICLLLVAPGLGALDINKGSFVIDIGIGYVPK